MSLTQYSGHVIKAYKDIANNTHRYKDMLLMNTHDIFDMHKEKKASFPNPINVSIKPDANQKLKHQLEGGSN